MLGHVYLKENLFNILCVKKKKKGSAFSILKCRHLNPSLHLINGNLNSFRNSIKDMIVFRSVKMTFTGNHVVSQANNF